MSDKETQGAATEFEETSVATGTLSVGMLSMAMTEAMGLAMHNAVSAQQNAQILNAAAVSATCTRILTATRTKNTRTEHSPAKPAPAKQVNTPEKV
jgi:hypothetical protein